MKPLVIYDEIGLPRAYRGAPVLITDVGYSRWMRAYDNLRFYGKLEISNHEKRIRDQVPTMAARHRTADARRLAGRRSARAELMIRTFPSDYRETMPLEQRYPPNHAARYHNLTEVFPPAPPNVDGVRRTAASLRAGDRGTYARPLTIEQRRERYAKGHPDRLPTPRQRRRLAHKQNLATLRQFGT